MTIILYENKLSRIVNEQLFKINNSILIVTLPPNYYPNEHLNK